MGLAQSLLADGRPAEAWAAAQNARALVRAPAAVAIVEGLRARAAAAFRAALAARRDTRAHAAFGTFLLNEGRLVEADGELESAASPRHRHLQRRVAPIGNRPHVTAFADRIVIAYDTSKPYCSVCLVEYAP
ncbi:MAG: hypothetical protein EXR71_01010 [Myxococcales bacterium]|nr:hypothetical protein [Myxococcales bacterium]